MDLVSTVRKTGSRGGVNFSWDDVTTSARRENYLGHSLKAPVGRWQKGRDLNWYAKADPTAAVDGETEADRQARERREEIRKIKEAEEEAIAKALGLPIAPTTATGANAVVVEDSKVASRAGPAGEDKEGRRGVQDRQTRRDRDDERPRHRHHHHHSSSKHHKRHGRSRSRERNSGRGRREDRGEEVRSTQDRDRRRRSSSRDAPRRRRPSRERRRSRSPVSGSRNLGARV